jgi:hypothetical protein
MPANKTIEGNSCVAHRVHADLGRLAICESPLVPTGTQPNAPPLLGRCRYYWADAQQEPLTDSGRLNHPFESNNDGYQTLSSMRT